MRSLLFLFFLLFSVLAGAQTKNPFLSLRFDKVVFYDFEEDGEKGSMIVDSTGRHLRKIIKLVPLDSTIIKKLNYKLDEKISYGNGTASCFDPHCGFVYFLNGKPVAQITICLGCNRLHSDIDIPAQKQGKQGEGKEVYYTRDGMSKGFRQFINSLLKKYLFTHQIEPGSFFDK